MVGFLCQKKERVRSLLDANEELRSSKYNAADARYMLFLEEFYALIGNLRTLAQSLINALIEVVELIRV